MPERTISLRCTSSSTLVKKPAVEVPRKWAWHYRRLLGLWDRLRKDKAEHLAEVTEPLERASTHIADSASDEAEHDLAFAELAAELDALYEIHAALRRIENNTYGVCEVTGQPIEKSRLRAVPWTRFSEEAQRQMEKRGVIGRPHLGPLGSVREEVVLHPPRTS